MVKETTKLIRSISVNTDIYNLFRDICMTKGYVMSVQVEHMMSKFISENNIVSTSTEPTKGKNESENL